MINAQSQINICNSATNGTSAVGRVAALVSSNSIYEERLYIWQTEHQKQANWSTHDTRTSQLDVRLQQRSSWFPCRVELRIVLVLEPGLNTAQSSNEQVKPQLSATKVAALLQPMGDQVNLQSAVAVLPAAGSCQQTGQNWEFYPLWNYRYFINEISELNPKVWYWSFSPCRGNAEEFNSIWLEQFLFSV